MTDDRRSRGVASRRRVPAVVAVAVPVALAAAALSVAVGAVLLRTAAVPPGPAGSVSLPTTPPIDVVVGSVYLLVAVGTVGHIVRERSPHVPDPGERLW